MEVPIMAATGMFAAAAHAASLPGDQLSLVQLATEVVREWGALPEGASARRKAVLDAISASLGQVAAAARGAAERGDPPPPRLVALLRWTFATLASWSSEADPSKVSLVACLMTIGALSGDVHVLTGFSHATRENTELIEELAESIAHLGVDFSQKDSISVPLWEKETVERFIEADSVGDWGSVAGLWPRLEPASRPSIELQASVRLLLHLDLRRLARAMKDVSGTVASMQIIHSLSTTDRLRVALLAHNAHVDFAAVLLTLRGGQIEADVSGLRSKLLYRILRRTSADPILWKGWMGVIGRFPAHFQELQNVVGRVIAAGSSEAAEIYVEQLQLGPRTSPADSNRVAVTSCFSAFKAAADAGRQCDLWQKVHSRWSEWRFGANSRNGDLVRVIWSDLDYGVTRYALECIEPEARIRLQGEIVRKLNALISEWHTEKSDFISSWYRGLSELQPFAIAQAIAEGKADSQDFTQAFVPEIVQGSKFIEMMVGSDVERMFAPS